jgi:hypothetical protein
MNTWSGSGPDASRRRSQRVILSVPITVSGGAGNAAFSEKTQTLVINAHGALITLAAKISQGQLVKIQSSSHPEKQECRVVYVGPPVEGKAQLGVEFTEPSPHFWHIAFPPESWTPLPPDKPVILAKSEKAEKPDKAAPAPAKTGKR